MIPVRIGRIGRPHGLRGEVPLDGASLSVNELMVMGTFLWRGPRGDGERALTLTAAREALPRPLLKFAGIDAREAASELTNGELWVDREQLPDPGPGVAYTFQLVGCQVVREDGSPLGVLEEIWSTGAHPIYVVRGEREWLLPAHEGVVRNVNLERGIITVSPPAGIEDI
ncbi:MAG: ribosome maturation factor RimM [Candidatus Eisenbacteria bacterium]